MKLSTQGDDYCVRLAELVRFLNEDSKQFPLSGRLLLCGLTVGMGCRALDDGHPDARTKRRDAAECLGQADYILDMAVRAGYLSERQTVHLRQEGQTLLILLRQVRPGRAATAEREGEKNQ